MKTMSLDPDIGIALAEAAESIGLHPSVKDVRKLAHGILRRGCEAIVAESDNNDLMGFCWPYMPYARFELRVMSADEEFVWHSVFNHKSEINGYLVG